MAEFKDLATQVSDSQKTEIDVKNEIIQLLEDIEWKITHAEEHWKWGRIKQEYSMIKVEIIKALAEDNEITREELAYLKNQIESKHENLANFYVENVNLLILEKNKKIVLKTLNKLKEKNVYVLITQLHQKLRSDIDIIRATLKVWEKLSTNTLLWHIPDEVFKNKDKFAQLLELSEDREMVTFRESFINNNWQFNVNNEDKNSLNNFLNNSENNYSHKEIVDWVESYIGKNGISNLEDNEVIKILDVLSKWGSFLDAKKFLICIESRVSIFDDFIRTNNLDTILWSDLLPLNLRRNDVMQKLFIDTLVKYARNIWDNVNVILDSLILDNVETAKYFFTSVKNLWEEKSTKIFSNPILRWKIQNVLEKNIQTDNSKDEIYNQMIEEFTFFSEWSKNLLNAVRWNDEISQLNEDDKQKVFSEYLRDTIGLSWSNEEIIGLVGKIIDLKISKAWKKQTEPIFIELLKVCWQDRKKAKKFIQEVKDYKIAKLASKNKETIAQKWDEIDTWFNIKHWVLTKDFDIFLSEKIKKFKELDYEIISKNAIEEYIKIHKIEWISEETKESIRKILSSHCENKQTSGERNNPDLYLKALEWKVPKEDYQRQINKELEKGYDFKAEEEIINRQTNIEKNYAYVVTWKISNNDIFTPTEKSYAKVDWWYALLWNDWEPIIKWLVISKREKNLTKWDPEKTKDLINFYETLKELWLSNLWKYRGQISNTIWRKSWSNLNYTDLLDENEVKIFLNSILISIWMDKIDPSLSFTEFKNLFKSNNEYQVIWNWYNDNIFTLGNSSIEELFIKKYIKNWIFQYKFFQDKVNK